MRLHDPQDEAALLDALRHRRSGRVFEREPRLREGWFNRVGAIFLRMIVVFVLLGDFRDMPLGPGWRMLMLGALFTAEAARLEVFMYLSRYSDGPCLLSLPLSGITVCRWIRWRVLVRSWTSLLPAVVAVWLLHHDSFQTTRYDSLVSHTVVLWLIVIATAAIIGHPVGRRSGLALWWKNSSWGLILLGIVALYTRQSDVFWMHPERWMEGIAPWLASTFPASWIGSTEHSLTSTLILTTVVLFGVWQWINYPRSVGPVFDKPQDFFGNVECEETAAEEQPFTGKALSKESESAIPDETPPSQQQLPQASSTASEIESAWHATQDVFDKEARGWIEGLVALLLGSRARRLAPVLLPRNPGWSTLWLRALWIVIAGILLTWLANAWLPPQIVTTLVPWLLIAEAAVVVLFTVPLSNGLHYAAQLHPTGAQMIPALGLLPITAADLMHFVLRVTWIRSLAAMPLMAMACAGNAMALGAETNLVILSAKMGVSLIVIGAMQRPLLLSWRLHERSRWRGWQRLVSGPGLVLLALGSLIVGFVGFVMLMTSTSMMNQSWSAVAIAWALLAAHGGLNYTIFLLYRQALRRARIDFIRAA